MSKHFYIEKCMVNYHGSFSKPSKFNIIDLNFFFIIISSFDDFKFLTRQVNIFRIIYKKWSHELMNARLCSWAGNVASRHASSKKNIFIFRKSWRNAKVNIVRKYVCHSRYSRIPEYFTFIMVFSVVVCIMDLLNLMNSFLRIGEHR